MSQLNLKVQFQAFDKMSKQFENIRKNAGKLGRAFDDNVKTLKKLDSQMHMVNSFKKQEKALSSLANDIENTKNKSREFQYQLSLAKSNNATTKQIQALSAKYQKNQKKTKDLIRQHQQLKTKLGEAGSKLKEAGISTKNLTATQASLKAKAQAVNNTLTQQSQKLEKLTAKHKKAAAASKLFNERMGRIQQMSVAGYSGMAVGRKMATTTTSVIRPGIAFGEQMSAVQAKLRLDKNSEQFKRLREQAIKLGSTTSFSASEVAGGQEFLAMAGFNSKAIEASMGDVLNLAKATGTELPAVADIASNIGGAFKIDPSVAGNFQHLADVLAYTTSTANVDITMLGETMKYLGQAEGLNLSLEQAAAMAGMLGNIGIQGTMAGTTISSMMNRLSAPAAEGKKAMKALGVQFTDTGDNAKDFVKFLAELDKKTAKMGNAKKAAYIKAIFGKTAVSGMNELITQAGSGELDKYVNNIKKVNGVTQSMADVMANNAAGDIKSLTSAWEGFNIILADSVESVFREALQTITGIIRQLSAWAKANPEWAKRLLIVAGAGGALIATFGGLLIVIAGIRAPIAMACRAMSFLGFTSGNLVKSITLLSTAFAKAGAALLTTPLGLIVVGIAAIGLVIYKYWKPLKAFISGFLEGVSQACQPIKPLINGISKALGSIWKYLSPIVSPVINFFKDLFSVTQVVEGQARKFGQSFGQIIGNAINSVVNFFSSGIANISATILNWSPVGLFYKVFAAVMDYFGIEMPDSLTGFISNTFTRMKDAVLSWNPLEWFKSIFSAAFKWVDDMLSGLVKTFVDIKNKISNFFSDTAEKIEKMNIGENHGRKQAEIKRMQKQSDEIKGSSRMRGAVSKGTKTAMVTNHITVNGSNSPQQTARAVGRAVGDSTLYDGVV